MSEGLRKFSKVARLKETKQRILLFDLIKPQEYKACYLHTSVNT